MPSWCALEPVPGLSLHLAAGDRGLCRLSFTRNPRLFLEELSAPGMPHWNDRHPVLEEAARQLADYFHGRRREFRLPLDLDGTPFQLSVWRALETIPYGETRSYRDVARQVGRPAATRAVGAANGGNPIAIIVPCHRVIASGGTLGGYGGGLPLKRMLLALEAGQPWPLVATTASAG